MKSYLDKDAKIYVAGHRGLVGSAIWNNLRVRGFVNLIGRSHTEMDLCDANAVRDFMQKERPDAVVLAAAKVGGIMANSKYRADFIYQNLQIQQNVIGESWRCGVQRLLFLGSTCIYPREASQPIKEEALLTSPLEYTNEPYAIAKIAGLKMCESFNLQYGTDYLAVMPTNLYGPRDNFDLENSHVMPAMIRKIHLAKLLGKGAYEEVEADLHKRPLPDSKENYLKQLEHYGIYPNRVVLWGSGKPLREFLWSEDMADASVHVLLHTTFSDLFPRETNEIRNCHINIGTGKEISIQELSQLIADVEEYEGIIEWDSTKPDGTPRKLTDISRLEELGWAPKVELEEGIKRLYQWYLEN